MLLRPFELTDVDDVYAYARDPEWGRWLSVPSPFEHRHAVRFVARSVLTDWETRPVFATCLNGKAIGAITLQVDASKATAQMGYSLAREHWGKGFTAEAASAVMGWAFKNLGLARIASMADPTNRQSLRVMEKLGMTREGVLRSERPSSVEAGSRQDMEIHSILREEWSDGGVARAPHTPKASI